MRQISTALSALQQAGVPEAEFRSSNLLLREVQNVSLMRVRSLQPDSLASAMRQSGMELPVSTGQSYGDDLTLMCLRPGEWLVLSETLSAGELRNQLNVFSPAEHAADQSSILDASDALAVLRVTGAAAPWLLAKLSGLDFLGASRSVQHCARTRMGQVAVIVNYRPAKAGANESYDLFLDRSIARYLWELLLLSAKHAEELLAMTESKLSTQ